MRSFDTAVDSPQTIRQALTQRAEENLAQVESVARGLIERVRNGGDEELVAITRELDWPGASLETIEVCDTAKSLALESIGKAQRGMLARSAEAIRAFHEAERTRLSNWEQDFGGGRTLGQRRIPVQRVGVYVPGGKAVYPSTVLMACIPALVAGVDEVIVCTPPDRSGAVHPLVIAAAQPYAGRIFRAGGAQAIAAMAYGTSTIPRVDVIVGPGNSYVNAAKRLVYGDAGIDMLAGPSEVAIIADSGANSAYVASDLLAQTEHGPENRGILFTDSADLLARVDAEIASQRTRLTRTEILKLSAENLVFVKTASLAEAMDYSNVLAPEHLELQVRDPDALLGLVRNAGAVLVGDATGAPIGDYVAGPSHTLPTAGAARFSSPLSVATFLKTTSVIRFTPQAAAEVAEGVAQFAMAEGFDAHAAAALARAASPESAAAAAMARAGNPTVPRTSTGPRESTGRSTTQ